MGKRGVKPMASRAWIPLVRELFDHIDAAQLSYPEASRRIGVAENTIAQWRNGSCAPRIFHFECAANAVGYRVVLVPMEPGE